MNAAAETISITNRAGIIFLVVCCAAVSFMIWFLTSLTREGRSRQPQGRLRLVVKATALESVEALEDTLPAFGAASIRVPMTWPHTNVVDKKAIEIATASRRTWWRRRIASW